MDFLRIVSRSARFDKQRFAKDADVLNRRSGLGSEAAPARGPAGGIDFFDQDTKRESKRVADGSVDELVEADSNEETEDTEGESEDQANGDVSDEEDGDGDLDRGGADISIFSDASPREGKSTAAGGESDRDAAADSQSRRSRAEAVKARMREVKALRKAHRIHVQGADPPAPAASFADLVEKFGVPEYLARNATAARPMGCGFAELTPIQMQAIPVLLKGRELLACAPTGSGKSAAFIIPLLAALQRPGKEGVRALVLSPTRELAMQLQRMFNQLAQGRRFKVIVLSKANANAAAFGPTSSKKKDVLISTPLRLLHLLKQDLLDLSTVQHLVLDEADRLFDLGFMEQVDQVIAACTNPRIVRSLFSATVPQGVELMARSLLRDPLRVTIGARNASSTSVAQRLVFVGKEDGKLLAMRQLIQQGLNVPVLIFVQSIERAKQLFQELVFEGINVDVMHADRSRAQRDNVMNKFRAGEIWALICTDLMARGIDFKGVNCVINYDFPQSTMTYVHRVGRTGRGGRTGEAITLFTEHDSPMLRNLAGVMKAGGCEIPTWMLEMKPMSNKRLKKLAEEPLARQPIAQAAKKAKKTKRRRRTSKLDDGESLPLSSRDDSTKRQKKSKKRSSTSRQSA